VVEAHERKDFSRKGLSRYRQLLEESFVLKDLKTFRHAPHMLHIDRIYETYPELVCSMMSEIYRISGKPKPSISKLVFREVMEKVGFKNVLSDVLTAWRSL